MTNVTPSSEWMLTGRPYIVGIVGSEKSKFTDKTEADARRIILSLLARPGVTAVCSGHCHLGGIDIWAEEVAKTLGLTQFIFPPAELAWPGYKARNLQIVEASHEVHCITIRDYPWDYDGMRFNYCYHCDTNDHIKSGGCWTAKQAQKKGKIAQWHIV